MEVASPRFPRSRRTLVRADRSGDSGHCFTFTRVSELAVTHGLTVYDATYLELAQRERIPLATKDGALRDAAAKIGVVLL